VWSIYGTLAGIAGVLLASFLGVGTANAGQLTASAFSIVVLGGLGSVSGSLLAAFVVGYLETITAYLLNPTLRPIPALLLLVWWSTCARRACSGVDNRYAVVTGLLRSRLLWIAALVVVVAAFLPLWLSAYMLGVLTVAYYFGVFSMSWDLLFGFAGEVNFGPTFLIGLGAYTAAILNNQFNLPIPLCVVAGALAALIGGLLLAMPAFGCADRTSVW